MTEPGSNLVHSFSYFCFAMSFQAHRGVAWSIYINMHASVHVCYNEDVSHRVPSKGVTEEVVFEQIIRERGASCVRKGKQMHWKSEGTWKVYGNIHS